ncbi:hypothetical protein K1719_033621 [Acacia pycnantha]|nr:hypothetical protein K1719_033621 [Acacia pycnantha]
MEANHISSPLVWKEVDKEIILIGKVLSNKTYTRSTMELILRKAWNLQEGFDVIEIDGNAFMFKFTDNDEYNRILRGRPWSINGYVLNLLERPKCRSCEEFDFSRCPVWIQMHNVPMEAVCLENVVTIGGYVGEVMMAEDPYYNGRYLRGFIHARILLDLRRPLAYGFWLPQGNGVDIWTSIRYEKLQSFCYNCGKIRYDNRNCGSVILMSMLNPKEPQFGAWLTTKLCRSWDDVLVVVKQDWSEAEYAHKKKMEALSRKNAEMKRASEASATTDEEGLFFIKMNKARGNTVSLIGRRIFESGGKLVESGFKKALDANVGTGVAPSVNEGEGGDCSGRDSESLLASPLAMVVYNKGSLGEVIKGIGNLGLKRRAAKEWEASISKRRKKLVSPCSKPTISIFAENLRRTKAKARRSAKRKGKD